MTGSNEDIPSSFLSIKCYFKNSCKLLIVELMSPFNLSFSSQSKDLFFFVRGWGQILWNAYVILRGGLVEYFMVP